MTETRNSKETEFKRAGTHEQRARRKVRTSSRAPPSGTTKGPQHDRPPLRPDGGRKMPPPHLRKVRRHPGPPTRKGKEVSSATDRITDGAGHEPPPRRNPAAPFRHAGRAAGGGHEEGELARSYILCKCPTNYRLSRVSQLSHSTPRKRSTSQHEEPNGEHQGGRDRPLPPDGPTLPPRRREQGTGQGEDGSTDASSPTDPERRATSRTDQSTDSLGSRQLE